MILREAMISYAHSTINIIKEYLYTYIAILAENLQPDAPIVFDRHLLLLLA
jgi:hypothetical protein